MSLIKINIAGDFCPILRVEKLLEEKKHSIILADISDDFLQSDYIVANLECPITYSKSKIIKSGPHLKVKPSIMEGLNELGINLFTLANNHIMDYGYEGLSETLELLEKNNFDTVGAGVNYLHASKIFTKEIHGKRISFLNIAENEFGIATQKMAGANPIDPYRNYLQVKLSRESSDYLLVIIHGGNEYFNLPNNYQKKIAHFYCDIGADIVVFHHSHFVSGIEKCGDSIIFYGLGNFVFDWPTKQHEDWYIGGYLELVFGEKGLEHFKLIPFEQCNENPVLRKIDPISFNEKISKLSEIISDDESLNSKWIDYLRGVSKYYHYNMSNMNIFKKILYKNGLLKPFIIKRMSKPEFINTIRCESHREALIDIIKNRI